MKDKGSRGISRREFLKDAGLVVGGAAVGAAITYPLVPKAEEVVIKEVEVTKYKCPYCGATVDTFDALKAHVRAQHPAEAIPEEVPKYVCPYCSAESDTFAALKAHVAAEHPPEVGVVEPAFEPETTVYKRCTPGLVAYDIKNGRVVRGRPVHYDSKYPELKPFTFTARGKTLTIPPQSMPSPAAFPYRKRADSPCKMLFPLQRVDWEPGGDPAKINTQNRGKSKFKRISWDEAATIIASELTRVADKYGPEAVCHLSFSMGESKTVVGKKGDEGKLLDYWSLTNYGVFPSKKVSATASFVGGAWGGIHVWGPMLGKDDGYEEGDLLRDVADNTELMFVWPGDTVSKVFGKHDGLLMAKFVYFLKTLGVKMVHIDPVLNMGGGVFNDKWIQVLPNTDCALHLAVAYTWITEDTYDKDYIATHTVGFDKWKAYVMGDEDGIPKTPKWASPLCGVPVWTIKAIAREWVSHVTSLTLARQGGGICRAPYSTEPTRMMTYLLGMQGVGKPGVHQFRTGRNMYSGIGAAKGPRVSAAAAGRVISKAMDSDFGADAVSAADRDRQGVPQRELANAILNPPVYWWPRREQNVMYQYPKEGKSEVHLFWFGGASWLGGCSGGNKKFEAFQSPKIECTISSAMYMEEAPYYADIILPILCQMEVDDIKNVSDTCTTLFIERKALEPRGEGKTDFGAILEVAKKLGLYDKLMGDEGEEQFYQDQIKKGYEKSGWEDLVSWEELNEKGFFSQPTPPDWEEGIRQPMRDFYNDPVANPLGTPTGKFEFESQFLLENFPDDKERLPVAHYVRGGPAAEGWTHDEDRFGERGKKYPLLMVANTYYWGEHSMHGDIPWTREISKQVCWDGYMYQDLWVHPETAAARGIKHGDIVRFYNDRGGVLGAANVTEQIMPGVVHMFKARQCDYIIPNELNRAGSPNSISPDCVSRHVRLSTGYFGYLVELERVTGEQMDEWRKNYPEAFARDYDPAYGPLTSGWVEGGM